jgi:hypothetical protein
MVANVGEIAEAVQFAHVLGLEISALRWRQITWVACDDCFHVFRMLERSCGPERHVVKVMMPAK